MDGSRKRAWTPAEDEKLRTAVAVGRGKWARVAQAACRAVARVCLWRPPASAPRASKGKAAAARPKPAAAVPALRPAGPPAAPGRRSWSAQQLPAQRELRGQQRAVRDAEHLDHGDVGARHT